MADKKKPAEDDDETRPEDRDESDDAEGAEEETERDASTQGVAKALGVDADEEEAEEEAKEEAQAAPNRAARRREEARQRRVEREGKLATAPAKKKAVAKSEDEDEDEDASDTEDEDEDEDEDRVAKARDPLPKDRNARAKELLKRRQEAAEKVKSGGAIGLSTGEVVQDQLARAASGAQKWLKTHFRKVAFGVAATVGLVVAGLYYLEHQEKVRAKASDALLAAVSNDRGEVIAEGAEPSPIQLQVREVDPLPTYTTYAARTDAALAAYDGVIKEHPGSAAAVLAQLGKAGMQLDRGEADAALSSYGEILTTELAKADVDVKARALEGKGYAHEAKKEWDNALTAFRDFEAADKAFEDVAKYHQARVHLKKGEKDKAKELLTTVYKKLEIPLKDGANQPRLRRSVEQYLRAIDPASAPRKRPNEKQMPRSPEEFQELLKQLEQQQQQKHEEHGHEGGPAPPGGPGKPPMPMPLPEGAPGHDEHADDDGTR